MTCRDIEVSCFAKLYLCSGRGSKHKFGVSVNVSCATVSHFAEQIQYIFVNFFGGFFSPQSFGICIWQRTNSSRQIRVVQQTVNLQACHAIQCEFIACNIDYSSSSTLFIGCQLQTRAACDVDFSIAITDVSLIDVLSSYRKSRVYIRSTALTIIGISFNLACDFGSLEACVRGCPITFFRFSENLPCATGSGQDRDYHRVNIRCKFNRNAAVCCCNHCSVVR